MIDYTLRKLIYFNTARDNTKSYTADNGKYKQSCWFLYTRLVLLRSDNNTGVWHILTNRWCGWFTDVTKRAERHTCGFKIADYSNCEISKIKSSAGFGLVEVQRPSQMPVTYVITKTVWSKPVENFTLSWPRPEKVREPLLLKYVTGLSIWNQLFP